MPGFIVGGVGEQASGRPEAYYTYTWEVPWIYGRSGLSSPLIYLKEATFPAVSFGKETVKGASLNYKFASDVTWDDCRVSWYDTRGLLGVMREWRATVWTPEGGLQPADDYKQETVLETTLPDGSSVNQWRLKNSWPSVIRQGELTYTGSDVKVVDVTITYDWAEETPA